MLKTSRKEPVYAGSLSRRASVTLSALTLTKVTPAQLQTHMHTQATKFQMVLCRAHSHKKRMRKVRKYLKTQILKAFYASLPGIHSSPVVRKHHGNPKEKSTYLNHRSDIRSQRLNGCTTIKASSFRLRGYCNHPKAFLSDC